MATEDEFHLEPLSDDQIHELVRYIIDRFGIGLSSEELGESIGVVMENVRDSNWLPIVKFTI